MHDLFSETPMYRTMSGTINIWRQFNLGDKTMSELPCRNCICLAMCKSFYTSDRETSDVFGTGTRERMEHKCSILMGWLRFTFALGLISENVKEFHRFFRGIEE